jgi:hypothetical protein
MATRCADSLSIRGFLGYSLTEATPDHSSLSVIRQRLCTQQFDALHLVLLRALRSHGLLKGKHLGIDSSVMESQRQSAGAGAPQQRTEVLGLHQGAGAGGGREP